MLLDIISIVSWGVTYLLIIFSCKKQEGEQKRAIPLLPPLLNLSWELMALIACDAWWGHVVWYSLSILVFESCLNTISKGKQVLYFGALIVSAICFRFIFLYDGMLLSSFVINAIMSVCFWFDRKNLLKKNKITIAITKGVGTFAATLCYARMSRPVGIIGAAILVLDIAYLVYCIKEKKGSAF